MKDAGSTYMFGSIGDDSKGQMLKKIVENDGVKTRYVIYFYKMF